MRRKQLARAAFGLGSFLALGSAQGLTFEFGTSIYGLPDPIQSAFNTAAARWSANISTNITVRVNVDYSNLDSSTILGQTSTAWDTYSYSTLRQKLSARATSADDQAAVASLPSSPVMLLNRTSDSPYGSGNATPYLEYINSPNLISIANAQALGLPSVYTTLPTVRINSNPGLLWDFDPTNGVTSNHLDFTGVVTHELGHVLGFSSTVDTLDSATPGSYAGADIMPTPMDLFRFSAQSLANPSDGTIPIDLTTNTADKYFSINAGTTAIASFSTGVTLGDERQASHWKDNLGLGIMDPTAAYGELLKFSQLDRRMFDVIGYTLNNQWSWGGGFSQNWGDALNWPTACVPDGAIAVTFGSGGATVVQIGAPASAASLLVNNSTNLSLNTSGTGTLTAAMLTVSSGSTLNLGGGTLAIVNAANSGTFSHTGGTLRVSGTFTNSAGTATFGGTQNWLAGSQLTVNGGTARLNTDAGAGGANLRVLVNSGATVNLASSQHLKNVTISASASAVMIGAKHLLMAEDVSLADATSQLDLGASDLVIRSPQTTTLTQLANLVKIGRDSGWAATGITSSAARLSSVTTLVPTLNDNGSGGTFLAQLGGETLLPTDLIVRYTYVGDVDLNGLINASDFAIMKSGSINQAQLQRPLLYTDGDVDFSGVINAADFAAAKIAALNQGAPLYSNLIVVPEPGGLAALVLGTFWLLRRRAIVGRRLELNKRAF